MSILSFSNFSHVETRSKFHGKILRIHPMKAPCCCNTSMYFSDQHVISNILYNLYVTILYTISMQYIGDIYEAYHMICL